MKKLLFLFISILFFLPVQGQDNLEKAKQILNSIYTYYSVENNVLLRENYPLDIDYTATYLAAADTGARKQFAYLWPFSGTFSGVNAILKTSHDNNYLKMMTNRVLPALGKYYDNRRKPACYASYLFESAPSDRFYDDNIWLGIDFVELYNYTKNSRYLDKAKEIRQFILSGTDDKLGGGIYWCEQKKRSKNTCSNAPGSVLALKLFEATRDSLYFYQGLELYNWTKNNLQDPEDKLYWDNINLNGKVEKAKYAYNSGQMIQSAALLYKFTKNEEYLKEAQAVAKSAISYFTDDFTTTDGKTFRLLKRGNVWFIAVMLRGFIELYHLDHNKKYLEVFQKNLDYAWEYSRDNTGLFRDSWDGSSGKESKWLLDQAAFVEMYASIGAVFVACQNQPFEIVDLQCEHLINPIGIDSPTPRFSWKIKSPGGTASQTSYQLLVDTDTMALIKNKGNVWDSGVMYSENQPVDFKGKELKSFTRYFWKVIVFDEKKERHESVFGSFETAMMDSTDRSGKWIFDGKDINYKPAPYFRKEINLTKKIKSARIYISAAGLYELSVNGQKIGDRMLDPMYTRFDRRNLYSTFDVTSNLQDGKNVFGVLLGNGWYNHQSTAVWFFDKAPWRDRPKFIADIRITYEDGQTEVFSSDEQWKTTDSPVIFNSIYTAEHYDARKELPGWDKTGFDDSGWRNAVYTNAPSEKLVSQQLYPIRVTDRMDATKMDKKSDSCYIFSFPRNIAGVIELKTKGKEGTVLRIKHGERLYENGHVDMSNIDLHYRPTDDSDPFQTDIFILSGKEDYFSPKFNYKGFQYVEITSSEPVELKTGDIKALEMHSDIPQIGHITSSNPTLNKIWEAGNSSYLANLFGYPTDCPQREKNGWTGDSHIAIETGLYSFDAITVYEKWLKDFSDEQQPNGILPNIIPTSGWGYDWANGPDWTSAIAIIPWEIYEFYGDNRLLYTMYDNIKKYVDHIHSISPNDTTDWGLGDWVPVKTVSSKTLTSSLFYYTDVVILSKTAKMFNKENDANYYSSLAERIKNVINANFLNKETGIYCSGSQTEQATPLYWDIVPDELKSKVAKNLYDKVLEKEYHIDTGILGAKALLHALTENGYADAAYKIASQETFPSWGYWIVNGATTFYENWRIDAKRNDASLNHIMFGDIGAWMFKGLGGIYPDEEQPGFKHIILKPNFVEGLDHFEASHVSPYGEIISKWEKEKDIVHCTISIPANCSASFVVPQGMIYNDQERISSMELGAGVHRIDLKRPEDK